MALQPADRVKFYLVLVIAILLVPITLGGSRTIFNDGDVSWHIATGEWILSHGTIPKTDPFSFSWADRPWVPIEWGAEVPLAAAYRMAGYSGISALATAALVALNAIVFTNALRSVRPLPSLGVVLAMDAILIPSLLARPHLFAWALLAFWTVLMIRARERDRAPPLAAALLMVVWANMHGSFVMGLVVAAAFGLEAIWQPDGRARAFRQWGLFGLLLAIAVLVNANGIEGVLHPLRIANLSMLPFIDEWKPSSPQRTPFFFVLLLAVAALIVWKRPKMHPVRWMLLAFLLALAFLQTRHQAVLAIVSAVLLPAAFATVPRETEMTRPVWLAASGCALVLIAIRLAWPITPDEVESNPWKLIASVPGELRSQPVLNGYVMGGPLLLSGIKPYVDGRGDMYGDELVIGYKKITDGDAAMLDQVVDKWGIRWAILPHRYKKLVALLEHDHDWKKIREDRTGIVFVRVSA
ncbi:hypothetical protein GCM10023264_04570 [Sphingomonas daechungensis]